MKRPFKPGEHVFVVMGDRIHTGTVDAARYYGGGAGGYLTVRFGGVLQIIRAHLTFRRRHLAERHVALYALAKFGHGA